MGRRFVLVALLVIVACLPGCFGSCTGRSAAAIAKDAATQGANALPSLPHTDQPSFAFIGWLACACIAAGVISLIASFTPWLAFFPRKSSVVAIVAGFALLLAEGVLVKFFGAAVWAVAIVATVVALAGGVPWVIAFVRWSIARAGTKLAKTDLEAGVAVIATATGLTQPKHKDKRLALMDRVRLDLKPLAPA